MHLHTLRRESRQKETEPNILTRCVGKSPFFPQSLPRIYPSDRRTCANRKEHTPYSAVLRRGFAPRFSVLRAAAQSRVPIFTCKLIMNLLSDFVNIFTQKIVKTARMEARRPVLILSTAFCLRAHGALAKCDL